MFNPITVFFPILALSIDALSLVRSADALTIRHDEPDLALLPLIHRALTDQTTVAVVIEDGRLLDEISPTSFLPAMRRWRWPPARHPHNWRPHILHRLLWFSIGHPCPRH
ncbi:hypothetical protein Cni_G28980 [Canna indica]|uniref:Uncharacterized protein n=1 Tax=Canna indica TaxID=4628 RepID=A0AAQ3LAS6_9LILI|nr:hypothetical protein Cni_G28980 [Canna indica]